MTESNNFPPIANELAKAKGWDEFTRTLMLAGKKLTPLDESLRDEHSAVPGCESPVWLFNKDGHFEGYSPSKIIRGVLAVLLEKANSLAPQERVQFDFEQYLQACQLDRYLSQSRGNGIKAVIKRLQTDD